MWWANLGVTPLEALWVVISATGLYFAMIVLLRGLGQRTMASMSSFDVAAVIALGAVVGRAVLGNTPVLVAGLIGVATLLMLQAITGQLRRIRGMARVVNNSPVVLMAGHEVIRAHLAGNHIMADELFAKLRLAGIRNRSEVACVILESTGEISVLRCGEPIDPELLASVRGGELVPKELLLGAE